MKYNSVLIFSHDLNNVTFFVKEIVLSHENLVTNILHNQIMFFRRKRSILVEETKKIPQPLLQGSEQSSALSFRMHSINEATFTVIFNADLRYFRMK
jgi:hypothetical protein